MWLFLGMLDRWVVSWVRSWLRALLSTLGGSSALLCNPKQQVKCKHKGPRVIISHVFEEVLRTYGSVSKLLIYFNCVNHQVAIGLRSQIYLSVLELPRAPIFLLESWFNTWLYSTFPSQRLPSRHGIKGRWQTLITSMYHAFSLASPFQIHSPVPKVELFRLESLRAFPRHELLNGVMHLDRIEYLATS
jgi:hypothetical protein